MSKLFSGTEHKTNIWIIYFILLGVIQALWTNPSAFPPLPFRLLMMAGVFAPMLLRRELVLFIFPFFMILRGQLSTAYQYLPDTYSSFIYIALLILAIIVHEKSLNLTNLRYYLPLLILLVYFSITDMMFTMNLGKYVTHIFIAILLSFFIKSQKDINILSAAFVSVSTLLAVYYILMYNSFLETWNADKGIERSGWNDPNYFSTLLGVGFMVSVLYILDYLKSDLFIFNKKVLIIFCFIIFTAIVLTASRAGAISVSAILLYSLIKSKPRLKTIFLSSVILVLCATLLYNYGIFDTLLYRLFEQGNIDTGGDRTTIWAKVFENYGTQPFLKQLFGGGYWHRAVLSQGAETHNELVAVLADYGLFGVICFCFMIASMFSFKGTQHSARNIAAIYYLLCIVSLSPFQYVNIGFLLIWIFGLKSVTQSSIPSV